MRKICFALIMSCCVAYSQEKVKPSGYFIISGQVTTTTITLADLNKWKEHLIGDITITNHLGEKKGEAKALKGVVLKELLQTAEIKSTSPKLLSEYYFVCKASDGYKVVYSWNELFNTPVGDSIYLITEKNGIRSEKMEESILMVSPLDFKTGRRYVKSLVSIEVKRAE